ncbi:hypothetical protein DRQ17_06685 [bacterium]|nr:MAG: hypothetical protein DRQ17_06685 [bacterium]
MNNKSVRRFGTFNGVFLPTTLSILGVILFLRTAWTVGQAGLWGGLGILLLSVGISLITALSLSSLSTNITVGKGGIYYLISRSTGVEMGGTIGIPLFLSQSISVAFYILGFVESLKWVFPHINGVAVSLIVLFIFMVIALIGADFAVKVQYAIFGVLMLAVLSIFFTPGWKPLSVNLSPHFTDNLNFWKVFAVFFPAVTGISAGVGMSGELSNPGKSIPRGTLLAIGFTTVIYLLMMVKFSAYADYRILTGSSLVATKISRLPFLVFAGIWCATLSSTLTFIISAPRTLQALSIDRVVPSFLSHTLGSKREEPRLAVIITSLIAMVFLIVSNLNAVATTITIFFLITYGMTNLAAGLEALVRNPSFRPEFKTPWPVSILGVIGIIAIMRIISTPITLTAVFLLLILYSILKRREIKQTWGDVRYGFWFSLIRFSLFRLRAERKTLHTWRPNLMVFSGMPEERLYLVKFANWLGKGNGIITLFNILTGSIEKLHSKREEAFREMDRFITENKLPVFPEVEIVRETTEGIKTISQAHGFGYCDSNLVLLGWGLEGRKGLRLAALIRELSLLGKNVMILKYSKTQGFGRRREIHVWWGGKGRNEGLMLYIAYILTMNRDWHNAKIKVLNVSPTDKVKEMEAFIKSRLEQAKVDAEVVVLEGEYRHSLDLLNNASKDADLVIMGMQYPLRHRERFFIRNLKKATSLDKTYLLVRSVEVEEFFFEE